MTVLIFVIAVGAVWMVMSVVTALTVGRVVANAEESRASPSDGPDTDDLPFAAGRVRMREESTEGYWHRA